MPSSDPREQSWKGSLNVPEIEEVLGEEQDPE